MTSTVAEHYANHLAPVYSWMVGDFDAACTQADAFYNDIDLPPGDGQLAIDLGCGHGVHSIPLARRGYQVTCIDSSAHLIAELESRAVGLPVQTVNDDLTTGLRRLPIMDSLWCIDQSIAGGFTLRSAGPDRKAWHHEHEHEHEWRRGAE